MASSAISLSSDSDSDSSSSQPLIVRSKRKYVVDEEEPSTPIPPPPKLQRQNAVSLPPPPAPTKLGGHIRQHILITLSHAEQVPLELHPLVERLHSEFSVLKMVACKEQHKEGGFHYHIALHNDNASKHTATSRIRALYPEFEGRGIDVKFHKSWLTMLAYVTKEDPTWYNNLWNYTREEAEDELRSRINKTMNAVQVVRKHIAGGGSVASLVHNDAVAPFLFRSSAPLRFAEMVAEATATRSTIDTILELATDVDVHAARAHCNPEQLAALEVLARQLTGRRQRQRQLYCVGPSGTGKTFPFSLLAASTRCFIPCIENGERAFAGWDDNRYDWILINDFHDNIKFQLLSNLLEGAEMKLNGYGRQHVKRANVPVVITANKQPEYSNLDRLRITALHNRLQILRFNTEMQTSEDKEPELTTKEVCAIMANFLE